MGQLLLYFSYVMEINLGNPYFNSSYLMLITNINIIN